jgi:hypothetical protein
MAATMTCKRCGATMTGGVGEVIKWDISHDEYCPALHGDENEGE